MVILWVISLSLQTYMLSRAIIMIYYEFRSRYVWHVVIIYGLGRGVVSEMA